ncbi:D-hexose-6-phosphate mutarotase [Acerihabitans arboris]|uniref:Putative glucose-6-phosphate 1-epimerase n=1 Tax=Acerihabitans arboris TaxID=2691583 RepID=A0A845SHD7_9GAMM|nr:D-hexose-6-phosphate mutarotase [Acerihabitans arboris]NDL62466.1 D-hexose-6-phosphate mutarotase [Acerihabitans arboris]
MYNTLFALPVKEQLSSSISLRQLDELPVIVIDHPQVKAAVTLQGAHLLAWQPAGEEPVLWLSDISEFKDGVAIRGGVPICWPWFGKVASPNHGFARILPWHLDLHQEDGQQVTLALSLHDRAVTEQYWPKPFTLTAKFTLGATCGIELEAKGDFQNTTALHSYFNIKDIANVSVGGLGTHYIDKVNGGVEAEQQGDVSFSGEVDRVYTRPQDVSLIHDRGNKRVIEIHHHNHSDVVAWNPGAELARKMSDVSDEGYKTYVCVETARVNEPLVATPTAPARLSAVLKVRKA